MGDAPTWIFGTGEQHNDGINPSSRSYPGPGAYTVPGTLQQSPAFTFAPGDERQGRMRHRVGAATPVR